LYFLLLIAAKAPDCEASPDAWISQLWIREKRENSLWPWPGSEFVNFRFCRETKRYEMQQKGPASRQALSYNSVVGE